VTTHLTEEEQIEAFKRWWSENWVTIVLPLIVGVLLYVSWFWWQDQKSAQARVASEKYEDFLTTIQEAGEAGLTDEQKENALGKGEAIIGEYAKTLYADMTNLALGNIYMDAGDLDKAANTFNAVVQNATNESMELLAKARLAKVYAVQQRYDEALALLVRPGDAEGDKSFVSLYAEIRGDIFLAQGDNAAANTAFTQAMDNLAPQAATRSGLLQMKISSTSVTESEAAPESKSVIEEESSPENTEPVDETADVEGGNVDDAPEEENVASTMESPELEDSADKVAAGEAE